MLWTTYVSCRRLLPLFRADGNRAASAASAPMVSTRFESQHIVLVSRRVMGLGSLLSLEKLLQRL